MSLVFHSKVELQRMGCDILVAVGKDVLIVAVGVHVVGWLGCVCCCCGGESALAWSYGVAWVAEGRFCALVENSGELLEQQWPGGSEGLSFCLGQPCLRGWVVVWLS